METLGQQLKAAREARQLTLSDVEQEVRIPRNYLEALENETLDVFSSDVHGKGFLRNYALFLGLDADVLAELYDQMRGKRRTPPSAITPVPAPKDGNRSLFGGDILLGLAIVLLVALAAFSVYQRDHNTGAMVIPTLAPQPTPTVTPVPAVEGTAYKLDVRLNYPEHMLDVQQRVDYTNVTSQTLPNLILNVHPNHSRRTFTLNSLKVDMDGEVIQPESDLLDLRLQVTLPRPLKPNEHVSLFLDYTLNLPQINPAEEFSGGGFGYSKRTVSLGNWYPVMAPYRADKGWYGLTYFPVGDPYVTEVADYEVTITTTHEVIIAGTGEESRDGNRWHFVAEKARSFAFAASDQYQVATTQVGNTTVHSYFFPTHQDAGEVALETAAQAIQLFSELYGAYPMTDYRVTETEFAGGMEFTGMTFLGSAFYENYDGTTRSPLIALAAHEAAHQWLYSLVGNDQVIQPWLDEAPAEYSSLLYYERYLPEDTEWWWFYAVDQWLPTGKIDASIYEFRDNRSYMDAVYRRGAQFMRDLRATMGDPAFFAFMNEYVRRYSYQIADSQDFFLLVQEFTTADLIPLQEEYFRQRIRILTP